jgi:serine/threonine protein kinase
MAARLILGENEFQLLEEIGSGTYAKVYKAIDRQYQRQVAIKCMLLDSERYGLLCVVVREINLLLELKHPNIVHLYDVIRRDNEIYLILEYMNTDLHQYLANHQRPLNEIQTKVYLYQLFKGLEFCHRNQSSLPFFSYRIVSVERCMCPSMCSNTCLDHRIFYWIHVAR